MFQPTPKDAIYYKRASTVFRVAEFAAIFGFLLFFITCIGLWRDTITLDNLRYLMSYVDLSGKDAAPTDAAITFNTPSDGAVYAMSPSSSGSDVVTVTGSRVTAWHFSGSRLYDEPFAATTPRVTASRKNLLAYDVGGRNLAVFGSVARLCSMTLEQPVRAATIADSGCFAVITNERTYRSGVIVYGNEYYKPKEENELFRYMSADATVLSAALNASATRLVTVSVTEKDGLFDASLTLFDTSLAGTDAIRHSLSLGGALPLKVGYAKADDVIWVLTDEAFVTYDSDTLEERGRVSYRVSDATLYRAFDDCFVLVSRTAFSGSTMHAAVYAYDGTLLLEAPSSERVVDVCFADRTLYLLAVDELTVYDFRPETPEKVCETPLSTRYVNVFADEYGRYILVGRKGAVRGSVKELSGKGGR